MKCCFFGHRDAESNVKEVLKSTVVMLIKEGVTDFYVGNNGKFDYYVQQTLGELISKGYNIKVTVVLSYIDEVAICLDQKYTLYPNGLDKTPLRFAISKRNDYMISVSKVAIIHVRHSFSNTHKLCEKAKKKGLRVIEI